MENNWNLLEKVTDDKPHIYDVNTGREVTCPFPMIESLQIAAKALETVIGELECVNEELIEHDAYIRNDVGGFDEELSEKIWMIAKLYTDLFNGRSRREFKAVINSIYGCQAENFRYNEHGYTDTDIAAKEDDVNDVHPDSDNPER